MRDPYLEAMLKGEGPKRREKDKFEIALNKSIALYLETLSFEEDDLSSSQTKKERFESELREVLNQSELLDFLSTALQLIQNEGNQYFEKETHAALLQAFENAHHILNSMDLEEAPTENFASLLHLSQETMTSIFTLAKAKYLEQRYADSLSLFVLLTVLEPKEFDYWYRTGIVAQFCNKDLLAVKAYAIVVSLNEELVEAYLFSVESYMRLGMPDEAKKQYLEGEKRITEENRDLLIYSKTFLK